MNEPIKTLDVPDATLMQMLVQHAIVHNWPFGGHYSKDGGWTLSVPADRYGEFIRLRNTLKEI